MNEHLQKTIDVLKDRFGGQDSEHRGLVTVLLPAEQIRTAVTLLRDEFEFDFLSSLTAVDYWPETEPRFHVVYQLWSNPQKVRIMLRVLVTILRCQAWSLYSRWLTGTSVKCSMCSAFASRGTQICAGLSCRTIGWVTPCVRIILWDMKSRSLPSILTRFRSASTAADTKRRNAYAWKN